MASANIYIQEKNPDKNGLCKLMLSFSYKGQRIFFYTGEKVSPEHFDKAKQRANKRHPFQFETNAVLDRLCNDIVVTYKSFSAKGKTPTAQELKEAIRPKTEIDENNQEKNLAYYFDLNEKYQISQGNARSTRTNYRTLQRMFAQFERAKNERITLTNFDEIKHAKFIDWCIYDRDNIPNTIAKRNGFIKTFFAFCERNGAQINPFYKQIKVKKVNPEMIFLTEEELERLEQIEVDSYLEKTKDCFLFSCYTGLRDSDIRSLTLDHIHEEQGNHIIKIFQEKTKKKVTIAMSDKAIALMNKYKNSVLQSARKRTFLPVISNQKFNLYLKELGQLAEINKPVEKLIYHKGDVARTMVPKYELLTFHKARHTFATLSLQRGMPLPALQKIMGHKRIEETMIYAKVVESYQHDQLLKTWNTPPTETQVQPQSIEVETITSSNEFSTIKSQVIEAVASGKKELYIKQQLSEATLSQLQQMGFAVHETTPIQKLTEGLYYHISW